MASGADASPKETAFIWLNCGGSSLWQFAKAETSGIIGAPDANTQSGGEAGGGEAPTNKPVVGTAWGVALDPGMISTSFPMLKPNSPASRPIAAVTLAGRPIFSSPKTRMR